MVTLKAVTVVAALGAIACAQGSSENAQPSHTNSCGDIFRQVDNATHPNRLFDASTVQACLSSVPFNPAVASRFLKYVNDTIQFQSSLGSIKNPPTGYQRPGVDLVAGINMMQDLTSKSLYKSHYEFENHMRFLFSSAHDNHLNMYTFGASAFRFIAPHQLVSYSRDGRETPRLYIAQDAHNYYYYRSVSDPEGPEPSPIKTVNGRPAEEYLDTFSALHSTGNLDPHSDWNELMYHPYLELQGRNQLFQASTTYSGDTLTLVLENGTQIGPEPFKALYTNTLPTGPLETGGDFFNFFVLGFYPASFDPENARTSQNQIYSNNTENSVYEKVGTADVSDPTTTGALGTTGYDLTRDGFANYSVLVIPGFNAAGDDIANFTRALRDFTQDTIDKNQQRVLIDLQQNAGGSPILAIDTFRHFFPKHAIEPSFRMRAHNDANIIGTQFSAYWQKLNDGSSNDDLYILEPSLWVAQNRLDPRTGQNFTSWSDFYGPVQANGDFVTNRQRYNVSDNIFTTFSQSYPNSFFDVYGSGENKSSIPAQPFDAQDILILTDGLCNSACSFFVELMHYYAGVRTITVGGRPQNGPMQTAGRSRGGDRYGLGMLDLAFNNTAIISDELVPASIHLPERDPNLILHAAAFNALDVMREDSDMALQFTFDAADCRMFWTLETVFDYSETWYAAINATWMDRSRCVPGSTGFSTRKGQPATKPAPAMGQQSPLMFDQQAIEIGQRISEDLANLTNSGLDSGETALNQKSPILIYTPRFWRGIQRSGGVITMDYCEQHGMVLVPFGTILGRSMCAPSCENDFDCEIHGVTTNNCNKGARAEQRAFAGAPATNYRVGLCGLDRNSVNSALSRDW